MGQQIAVVASPNDEQALLAFLRESGPIQLCVRGAGTAAELWPDEFPPFHHTRTQYFSWNQAFAWTPKVAQQTPDGGGVIEDMATAPVVEFSRTFMDFFRRFSETSRSLRPARQVNAGVRWLMREEKGRKRGRRKKGDIP
jgi:hypothetical protein